MQKSHQCKNAQVQELSLRARKKAQTWSDIHDAAAEAVLERGLHAVTVEEIAASVGISQRTFFNYFPSKDHAVLGVRDPEVPEGILEHPPQGFSTLRRVVEVYIQLLGSAMPGSSSISRQQLMRAHPELSGLLKDAMHSCERAARDIVRSWAQRGLEPQTLRPGDDLEDRIGMLTLVAAATMRFVLAHPDRAPGSAPSPEDLDHAVELLDSLSRMDQA